MTSPLSPVYSNNGKYGLPYNDTSGSPWYDGDGNPYGLMMTNNNRENKDQYLLGDFYAELNPIQNLTLKTLFGINYYSTEFRNFTPLYRFSIYSYNEDHTTVGQGMSKGYTLTWTNTANYSLVFDNHNVEMLVGSESIQYQGMNVGGSNWDLLDQFNSWDYAYLDNTTGQATLIEDENGDVVGVTEKRTVYGGPSVESRRVSYFGRLAYNYAEKYLVNATFRADGSSRFARGNRWGYFPSVSIGWVISEEGFMAGTKGTLDYLKLRASWGQVGNQNIDNFQYASPMVITNYSSSSPAGYYLFGTSLGSNLKGAYPGRLANPNVKWETSEQINLGFDARTDEFITKPFSYAVLELKIERLITLRNEWHSRFGKRFEIKPGEIGITSLDEKFLNKVLKIVEKNMGSSDFNVEKLSRELGVSRGHLYNKLLALTGKTPVEFIRVMRLKRAAQYLEKSQLTVSEIAYMVGFNDPKYFSRYFKEEFGMVPSEYAKNGQGSDNKQIEEG